MGFPLRSETRQGYLLLLFLFNVVQEVPASAIRQKKEKEGIQVEKKEVKLSLFIDDIIMCVKTLMKSTKKKAIRISEFREVAKYKINMQKSIVFLYTSNKQSEIEIKNTVASKNI